MPYTFRYGSRPLDGITVQRAVGRGGFGEVYYAVTDSGKQVALKYLRDNPEIELRGIRHVMNLKSPHLITIYDVRRNAAGEPFVIMEYVSGPSLRDLLTAEPQGLGPQKAAFFLDGIAKGLAYLHEAGIVHRDLKPANIFYDDGYVKIGDYGLSKHISVSKHSGQTVSVGTVHYMAPEIGSGSYTRAIDIYALGVILYEMLTGRLPFTGASMGEILMRHLSDQPDLAGIPEPFAGVIAKALAKRPEDRFQDVNEMADQVRQCADLSAGLASFDPSTLLSVPRIPAGADADTVTTPPRVPPPPPPLDVRPGVEVPPPAEPVGQWADVLAERLEAKADRLTRRFEKKLRKAGGGRVVRHGLKVSYVPPELDRVVHAGGIRGRLPQLGALLSVCVAAGIGLALLGGGRYFESRAVSLSLGLIGATFGPLVTYFRVLRTQAVRSPLWDRLAYVGVTMLCLVPAFGAAGEFPARDYVELMITPLVVLLVCNWTGLIEAGRRGIVRAGSAVWPAVVGLIAGSILTDGDYGLVAAGMAGVLALLVQAGASLWPYTGTERPRPRGHGRRGQHAHGPKAEPFQPAAKGDQPAREEMADARAAGEGSVKPAAEASPAGETPVVIDAGGAWPTSWLGAFLGFLGVMLLLGCLALAVCFPTFRPPFYAAHAPQELLRILGQVNEPLVLVIGFLGVLLVVLARRGLGGAHVCRACVAGGLLLWASVMAMGPSASAFRQVMNMGFDRGRSVNWTSAGLHLALLAGLLLAALVLLAWPAPRRKGVEV